MTETSLRYGAVEMDNASQHYGKGPSTSTEATEDGEVGLCFQYDALISGHVTDLPTASDPTRLDWTTRVRQDDIRRGLGPTYEWIPGPKG